MRAVAAIAFAALLTCFGGAPVHAEKRVALVIGNGDYQRADKLANPVTDARRMRDALARLGFDVVYGENLGKQALERTIGRFANTAQDGDVAIVFFAGHGATFGDTPYVVPVDAQFSSLAEMPYELVPVETLIGELRRAKGLRIAILDACRDNAAERELKRVAARGGEISRGLARVQNPEGLILAYATQYLSTAQDGDPNGDSPFTTALLDNIATPGLDVKDLFFRVGRDVIATTKGAQRPEISVSFYDSYALVPAGLVPAAGPVPAAAPRPAAAAVAAPPVGPASAMTSRTSVAPPSAVATLQPAPPPLASAPATYDPASIVRAFYMALSAADGNAAAALVVPEKRGNGPFNETSIAQFYAGLREPLKILSVDRAGDDLVNVKYRFTRPNGSACLGDAKVTTVFANGKTLIKGIAANC
jgi:Caspase domain